MSSDPRQREIEYRALRVLERLAMPVEPAAGPSVDDPFVALFRVWPRPSRATARRLAAHANAARGRDLLWLVGVDETGAAFPGVEPGQSEEWIHALRPWFDGLLPRIVPLDIPLPSSPTFAGARKPPRRAGKKPRMIVALHVETTRAPFVFRADPTRLETPWLDLNGALGHPPGRNGVHPRSATRSDLIRLLTPCLDLPGFELLEAQLAFYKNPHPTAYSRTTFRWSLDAALYVVPNSDQHKTTRVVLPLHGCRGAVEIGVTFRSEATEFSVTPDKASPSVRVTESAVLIDDLGRMFLYLCGSTQHPHPPWQEPATLLLDLLPSGAERVATVTARLRPEPPVEPNQSGLWKL
jgi:hypothetical protein